MNFILVRMNKRPRNTLTFPSFVIYNGCRREWDSYSTGCWIKKLCSFPSSFNSDIKYKPSEENETADALCHLALKIRIDIHQIDPQA